MKLYWLLINNDDNVRGSVTTMMAIYNVFGLNSAMVITETTLNVVYRSLQLGSEVRCSVIQNIRKFIGAMRLFGYFMDG